MSTEKNKDGNYFQTSRSFIFPFIDSNVLDYDTCLVSETDVVSKLSRLQF